MPNNNSNNIKKQSNNNNSNDNNKQNVRSSTKRPRAPIACFRCHHKKVRCDGAHPNCIRCSSTGVLCAYPSSRRSRTTQPTNIDPFIDNLSHLEARIRRIESDLENQRSMVHSIVSPSSTLGENDTVTANELNSKMLKTELEVQDSRSILAQLRLRGEQRISKGKRAAAAAAAAAAANNNNNGNDPVISKEEKIKNRQQQQSNTKSNHNNKTKKVKEPITNSNSSSSRLSTCSISSDKTITPNTVMMDNSKQQMYQQQQPSANSFYFQGMMLDNNTDLSAYDQQATHGLPPGHGMDWTLFDNQHQQQGNEQQQQQQQQQHYVNSATDLFATQQGNNQLLFPQQQKNMIMDISPSSSRSSSLTSHLGYPVILQPSNSTTSTTSNATSATTCSSMNSCENIFGFPMDDMMLNPNEPSSQDVNMLSNNPAVWYYSS